MKKRAIILLICCLSAVAASMELEPTSPEERARLEKLKKAQEAYFEKHGKYKETKLPTPSNVENPTPIDIESLKKIEPDEIAEMQIYRLEWINGKPVKRYSSIEFGEDSRQEVEAIMKLIKEAPKVKSSERGLEGSDPDRALVVRLANGSAVEIFYDSHLRQPFVGLDSRKLKEALCGLSGSRKRVAIMHIIGNKNPSVTDPEKKVDVTHMSAQSVQRSGVSRKGNVTVALKLNADGDLVLGLTVKDASQKKILVTRQKKIQYGGAVVFEEPTIPFGDMFIAYLLEPSER